MSYNFRAIKSIFVCILFLSIQSYSQDWATPQVALKSSATSHRPVLVFIYQDTCNACKDVAERFSREKFYPPILNMFELSRITIEDAREQFGMEVNKTPTFLFLDAERNEIAPMIEGSPADDLEFSDYLIKATISAKLLSQEIKQEQ